jgi:hypothetical protein
VSVLVGESQNSSSVGVPQVNAATKSTVSGAARSIGIKAEKPSSDNRMITAESAP